MKDPGFGLGINPDDPNNTNLDISHLEPGGEDNLLEYEPTYNPLRYCYLIPTTILLHDYQLAVKFQIQQHTEHTPINFIDPKTGKPHEVPLFPILPEIGIEPDQGPEPDLNNQYQIGENTYYLAPTLHRVKNLETGDRLTRDEAMVLVTPERLQQAIGAYGAEIAKDPNAPADLAELFIMWTPGEDWKYLPKEDDWYEGDDTVTDEGDNDDFGDEPPAKDWHYYE